MNNLWLQQAFKNGMTPNQVVFGPNTPPSQVPITPPASAGATTGNAGLVGLMASVIRFSGYTSFFLAFILAVATVIGFYSAFEGIKAAQELKGRGIVGPIADVTFTIILAPLTTAIGVAGELCAGCILILVGGFVRKHPHLFE